MVVLNTVRPHHRWSDKLSAPYYIVLWHTPAPHTKMKKTPLCAVFKAVTDDTVTAALKFAAIFGIDYERMHWSLRILPIVTLYGVLYNERVVFCDSPTTIASCVAILTYNSLKYWFWACAMMWCDRSRMMELTSVSWTHLWLDAQRREWCDL